MLAMLKVGGGNIDKYFNFIYFEMIQRLKYTLDWSLAFVASVYAPNKIMYIITRKVYASIKVKNTSYGPKLHA